MNPSAFQSNNMNVLSSNSQSRYWYNRKWVKFVMHGAFWLLLFSLPQLLGNRGNAPREHSEKEQLFFWVSNLLWIGLFYINIQWLIPKVLYRKNLLAFITAHLLLLGIYLAMHQVLRNALTEQSHFNQRSHLLFTTIIYLFFTGASSTFRLVRDHMQADQLEKEKKHENLKTELSFLRSQVSPHFMFNVLNNMVALARKKSELLEPSLIKLSSLMRYMLYETDGEKVSLEKEAEYLQSYIDLQQQRFGNKLELLVQIDAGDEPVYIEPMLLIPFVENAFKHGTGLLNQTPRIEVQLKVSQHRLYFFVSNRFEIKEKGTGDKTSGIGLANVKRRLELLYPGMHRLEIEEKDALFTVTLQLNLLQ